MKKTLRSVLIPLISIGIVGLIWQLVIVGFHVQPYVAPKPWDAVMAVIQNWGLLWPLVLGTIRETVYGFFFGAILGVVLGVVMSKLELIRRLVYPLLVLSQAVPIIALASPLVLILGFSVTPKIVIVAWIVFFPVTVNVVDGLTHVDQDLLNLARVYGASSWRTFTQIELPGISTPLFSGLKIGATYAVGGAIIAELVGSTGSSLAFYQEHASANLQTPAVYGTTLVMTVIGIGWFLLVAGVEMLLTPWQRRNVARRRRVARPAADQ
ncbi:MAG: ABC transporter permease [Acidimicrobiaceae bacterium]|nr:ABC transporter permease [Acidimicrobiaceae bacterium]